VEAGNMVTDQAGATAAANLVTPTVTSQAELMNALGVSHRTFFRRNQLEPLLRAKLVQMTHPEEPNHPGQAYVVTEGGMSLLSFWKSDADNGGGQE
jgi:hypothetical protein